MKNRSRIREGEQNSSRIVETTLILKNVGNTREQFPFDLDDSFPESYYWSFSL